MNALRKVARGLRVPWQLPVRRSVTLEYRTRWLLASLLLAALVAVDAWALNGRTMSFRSPVAGRSVQNGRGALSRASRTKTAPLSSAPRLKLSTDRLDLGDGKPYEVLRGELTLSNPGSTPVKFALIKHCGCTELSPLSGELAPGTSETIRVGLKLADHANSEKTTSIEIQTGEAPTIVARCVVSARCPAPFSVTPAFINFGYLSPDKLATVSHQLQIDSVDGQRAIDRECLLFQCSNGAFEVTRTKLAGAARGLTLSVAPKHNLPAGDHWDTLELRLNGSVYLLRVALNITVTDRLMVIPRTVSLRNKRNAAGPKPVDVFVIDHRDDGNVGPVSLVAGPPGLAVEDLGDVAPRRRRVRLSFGTTVDNWPEQCDVRLGRNGENVVLKLLPR